MWYYATILYIGNYYRKDPRERAGLAASAIAVSGSSSWCKQLLNITKSLVILFIIPYWYMKPILLSSRVVIYSTL